MKVRFDSLAKMELDDAVGWYAAESVLYAERFVAEFESLVAAIVKMPGRFAKVAGEARKARFMRYPYSIIFTDEARGDLDHGHRPRQTPSGLLDQSAAAF